MKRVVKYIILTMILLFVMYHTVPSLIHVGYRLGTSEKENKAKRELYNRLANTESALTGKELEKSWEQRRLLYNWFHARGRGIDEGDEREPFGDEWKELWEYWTDVDV